MNLSGKGQAAVHLHDRRSAWRPVRQHSVGAVALICCAAGLVTSPAHHAVAGEREAAPAAQPYPAPTPEAEDEVSPRPDADESVGDAQREPGARDAERGAAAASAEGTEPEATSPPVSPLAQHAASASSEGASATQEPMMEVVELGDGDLADATSAAEAESVRNTTAGWLLLRPELAFGRGDWGPDVATLPTSRARSLVQLFLRTSAVGKAFEAAASGALSHRLQHYGQTCHGCRVRSSVQPDLREAYVGGFNDHLSLRVGQQRVAWGIMEIVSPNDVANAQDLTDPALTEQDLRALPTPLVRFEMNGERVGLQLLAGVFVPDRLDLIGTPWAAIQADAPLPVRAYGNAVRLSTDASLYDELNALSRQTSRPRPSLRSGVYGARLNWRAGTTDVQHYYQYGYDATPVFTPSDAFLQVLGTTDWNTATLGSIQAEYGTLSSAAPYSADYVRRHHVGSDITTIAGPFILRLDGAYQSKRVLYETSFASFVSPAVRVAASFEYQTPALDEVVIVETFVQHLTEAPPNPLLSYTQTTWGVGTVLEWPIAGPVVARLRSLCTLSPWSWAVRPEFVFVQDGGLELGLGALTLGGERFSLGGYFADNSGLYARARHAF